MSPSKQITRLPLIVPSFLLLAAAALTGCGSGISATTTQSKPSLCGSVAPAVQPASDTPAVPRAAYNGPAFTASVLAGSKPIAGAAVSLFAAGSSGNGSSPTSLVASALTTDATGSVAIPQPYTCPSSSALLYLVATGGTVPGASAANPAIELMTPVGPCGSVASNSHFTLNEATTAASLAALAQFYAPGKGIGASSSNLTGLENAFATAATLADPLTGATPGATLPANAESPAPRINSLANAANACVVNASACTAFFAASASTGAAPANTLDALYDIVRSPTANVSAVYTASQASSAFVPALTAAPADWTTFITYSGAGLSTPSGIGVDSTGSVWVASYFYTASKFSPTGSPIFPNGITGDGLNNSYGLAIDLSDNVWIPNEQPVTGLGIGSVSVLTPAGAAASGPAGYIAGGLNYPLSIAIDPNGTAWVVDYGNSHVTLLNPSGQPISGTSGYTTPDFAFPVVVAVDGNHFGWIGNLSDSRVTKVAPDGSTFTSYNCCQGAAGIALDASNNVWIANFYGDSVSAISCKGDVISNLAYTGDGSLNHPQGIAVDGSGNLWVANYRAPYLTELSGAASSTPGASLTPAAGLGADAKLLEAYALALDSSGNIWVSNQGSDTITKFVGLAAPVKTPLSGLPALP